MKLPRLHLRDLFWLVLISSMLIPGLSFGEPNEARTVRRAWRPGTPGGKGELSAPVFYRNAKNAHAKPMLILTNKKGAAAVIFDDSFTEPNTVVSGVEIAGVRYRYRYESFDGEKKLQGSGELYEEQHVDRMGGDMHIEIADLVIGWSAGDIDTGFIYYSPETTRVHLADGRAFAIRFEPIPMRVGAFKEIPALNLHRFKL